MSWQKLRSFEVSGKINVFNIKDPFLSFIVEIVAGTSAKKVRRVVSLII